MGYKCAIWIFLLFLPAAVPADVTYTFYMDDVDESISSTIEASVIEAVGLYNQYGSFNKHLNIYYNSGVETAQASYSGTIEFGGSRNTRVALHEIGHTVGVGQHSQFWVYMVDGVWQGHYATQLAFDQGTTYEDGLHGDSVHIWPWGLNYDSEDGFMERIKHVRMMAALRCDMGILAFSREAQHQTAALGQTATFQVFAPSADSYQWYKDGTALTDGDDISGATDAILQIANVDLSDEGSYYCAATGADETLNCRAKNLRVEQLLGQWDFDGDLTDSANAGDATATGSPAYAAGVDGQAIVLDGSDDYLTLPEDIANSEDLTIAAWIYWNGGDQWQRIFDFGSGTSQYLFLTPGSGTDTLRFAIKDGDDEQIVETSILPTGQWVHVAVVLRENTATLYVDGQAEASNGETTIDPRDFSPTLNYMGDSQYSADPLFDGRMDDFRVYNYALGGSDIWQLWGQSSNAAPLFSADPIDLSDASQGTVYAGGTLADYALDSDGDTLTYSKISGPDWLTVASDGTLSGTPGSDDAGENTFLVRVTDTSGASDEAVVTIYAAGAVTVHYPFEDDVLDSSGNSLDATATGSPAYVDGTEGQAIVLDGSDDYLTLPEDIADTEDLTIAAWIYWNGGDEWQRVFDFGTDTSHYLFLTPSSYSGTLRFAATVSGYGDEQQVETDALETAQWDHVAVTLKGDTATLYVNGLAQASNPAMTIDPADFNPSVNYIAKSQWSTDPLFDGQLDDFRIYSYALSEAEIALLANAPAFTSDTFTNAAAVELAAYDGLSLTDWIDPAVETESLTFSRDAGPGWLNVASDGELSGVPSDRNVGENVFTVCVENSAGLSSTAEMTIQVADVYSGVCGLDDLVGLAANWLLQDCGDSPACGGADLTGDQGVDLMDFQVLTQHWLADESLQLYLKLDDASGTTASDSSIYGRSGELINGPVWTSGISGGALEFDGVDDYVEITGYKGIQGSGSRTCVMWIKTETANKELLSWGGSNSGGKWLILVNSAGCLRIAVTDGSIQGTTSIADGSWHHIAVVLEDDGSADASEIEFYIDGTEETIDATTAQAIDTENGQDVQIGLCEVQGSMRYFDGLIDDVRIYDRALSETEIQNIAKQSE